MRLVHTPHRLLSLILLGGIVGIAFQTSGMSLSMPFCVIGILMILLPRMRFIALFTAMLVLGFLYAGWWRARHAAAFTYTQKQTFIGIVDTPPDPRGSDVRFALKVSEGPGAGHSILVTAPAFPPYTPGEKLQLNGKLQKPEPFSGFDYPRYLERSGIYATAKYPGLVHLDSPQGLNATLLGWRAGWEKHVNDFIAEPDSSFVRGILFGSGSLPDDLENDVRASGTAHLVSASGANVTLVLGAFTAAVPLKGRKRRLALTLIASAFVCVITGASASVIRGAATVCTSAFARTFARKSWFGISMLGTTAVLLLFNPLLLVADVGFQLSIAAHAGIILFVPKIEAALKKAHCPPGLIESIAVTCAASAATAPVSLYQFGETSLLGLIANPLILWAIPALTGVGYLLVLVGKIQPLARIVAFPTWLIAHAALAVIRAVAHLPFGRVRWGDA